MKYDFFKDINNSHGLNCSSIYSQLFKNIKFIPKTYYLVTESIDDNGNKKGYIYVETKYSKGENINLYFRVFTQKNSDYFIHDVFFVYNDVYYVISNIHLTDDGIAFDYNWYKSDSYKIVCEEKNRVLPRPEHFANIKPSMTDHACLSIYGKFDNLGFYKDIISYLIGSYEFDKRISEPPISKRRK